MMFPIVSVKGIAASLRGRSEAQGKLQELADDRRMIESLGWDAFLRFAEIRRQDRKERERLDRIDRELSVREAEVRVRDREVALIERLLVEQGLAGGDR